jgi:hypothetical protein
VLATLDDDIAAQPGQHTHRALDERRARDRGQLVLVRQEDVGVREHIAEIPRFMWVPVGVQRRRDPCLAKPSQRVRKRCPVQR